MTRIELSHEDRLKNALKYLLEQIPLPERNCSCHISPPCHDCVENGALRTAVEEAEALLKALEE